MKTTSKGAGAAPDSVRSTVAPRTLIPGMPVSAALRRATAAAARSDSTSRTEEAPRLAASRPSAPDPAYRSSTAAPARTPRCSSRENSASRTRSLVGRVPLPAGVCRRRPPTRPLMMRVTGSPAFQEGCLLGVDPLVHGGPELRVVGEYRVGGDEGGRVVTGLQDDLLVAQQGQEPEAAATHPPARA